MRGDLFEVLPRRTAEYYASFGIITAQAGAVVAPAHDLSMLLGVLSK